MRRFLREAVPQPSQQFDFHRARYFSAIDLEIGSGVGRFAIQRALHFPKRALIAIEKTAERYSKFERRLQNHSDLPNLLAVHSEAVSVITHFIPPESLDQIFILYPNPYPKMKQRNLRWHNRAFMGFLIERLRQGGTLTLATNEEDYHDEAIEVMKQTWAMDIVEDRIIHLDEEPRTHFEKKYLLRNETCWNMIFKKP